MESNIEIIGNQNSIQCYNLNKQFSNVKKIIITKEILLESFENEEISNLIRTLKSCDYSNYKEVFNKNLEVFQTNIKSELYQQVQDSLTKLSNNYVDVQLKNYNFMNAVSNTKFNITIRCESFSITKYYVEKGTILTNIRNLMKEYLGFEGNIYRLNLLDNIQLEISQTEEIFKHIYLKKEGSTILLGAVYGFPKNKPIDYQIGQEFYISKGNEFEYFQNNQTSAILREHNKLVEKEIKPQDKILSNNDLININEKTKGIEDVLIECYINAKGQLRIVNLTILENSIQKYSKNGFIINKSSNNYNSIAIITPSDNYEEETVNPKYLLLKTESSIKEFFDKPSILEFVDGIIITKNFYLPYFETIGMKKNIDIIYFNKNIQKSVEEKIEWNNLDIENSNSNRDEENPFNSILSENNKEKDEMLERLKNIDLYSNNNQEDPNSQNREQIESTVNSLTSSAQSSFNKKSSSDSLFNANSSNNSNEKKSAFGMLMDAALNQKKVDKQEEVQSRVQQNENSQTNNTINQQEAFDLNEQDNSLSRQNESRISNQSENEFQQNREQGNEFQQNRQQQNEVQNNFSNNMNYNNEQSFNQPNKSNDFFSALNQSKDSNNEDMSSNVDIKSRYHDIRVIEVIGDPNLNVDAYFVDKNTISQVGNKKTYFLTLNPLEMQNSNLNYILPIGLNNKDIKNCSLLINNPNDYFLIDKNQKNVSYFVNVSELNNQIKKRFIDEIIDKVGEISLICLKEDIEMIKDDINKINSIQFLDAKSNEEISEMKNKILVLEKKYLMKRN